MEYVRDQFRVSLVLLWGDFGFALGVTLCYFVVTLVFFWVTLGHFGNALGSLWVSLWGYFGMVFGSFGVALASLRDDCGIALE